MPLTEVLSVKVIVVCPFKVSFFAGDQLCNIKKTIKSNIHFFGNVNHGSFKSNANFIAQLNGMLATKGNIKDN